MRGQPNHLLSSTLDCHQATFRDLMIKGEFGRCDWLKQSHNLETHTGHIQEREFSRQSQRRISPLSSNHGISPDDSVDDSRVVVT
jgi:hypothetical protein